MGFRLSNADGWSPHPDTSRRLCQFTPTRLFLALETARMAQNVNRARCRLPPKWPSHGSFGGL
jgi:hypothetical protein